jgi:bifunctional non-homologous end joining protein LigD
MIALVGDVENATLVQAPPAGAIYSWELKYDGYRILAVKLGHEVRLISRRGQDWTHEFPEVAAAVARLNARNLVLDGEVVAPDERGVPSFQRLQKRVGPFSYLAFDLLWLDGRDLRAEPLELRRVGLQSSIGNLRSTLGISSAISGDVQQLLKAACDAGFEGLIGKRVGSAYRPGRGLDWIKLKCQLRQEFAVVGYLPYTGTQLGVVGSLLLALCQDGHFVFSGKVGTGFDQRSRSELGRMLEARHVSKPAAVGVRKFAGIARFNALALVAEVKFSEWTEGGNIRHSSYVGLRPDKRPEDCVREGTGSDESQATTGKEQTPSSRAKGVPTVVGVRLSNADRVLTPLPLSKLNLARYYEAVGEWMLPHVRERPLTLVRWAEGKQTEKGGVYLRHAKAWGPDVLRRIQVREQKKVGEYLVVDNVAGLVALAQMDILEIHAWNSVADDLERPNRVVFDLDPDPSLEWVAIVDAARTLRAVLQDIGLESWIKTTGGKGVHLVVPLIPEHDWATCHQVTREIATRLAAADPKRFVATVGKDKRRGKILIDYLRNNRGNTSVAAYSTRASARATVSTPIHWDELTTKLSKERFTVDTVLRRLIRQKTDPWQDYWTARQHLLPPPKK